MDLIIYDGNNYRLTKEEPYEATCHFNKWQQDAWMFSLILPDTFQIFSSTVRVTGFDDGYHNIDVKLDTFYVPKYFREIPQKWFDVEDELERDPNYDTGNRPLVEPALKVRYYKVSEQNQTYSDYNGCLYSKDFKRLKECPFYSRMSCRRTMRH